MRILASILLALILSLALVAAPPQPRSQLQNMVDKLNLTADQKAKADPILDADAKQVRALRDDSALTAEDRAKKTAEIRRQSDLQLKPILTAEQWTKLEQLRAERKAQGKQGKKKK
jgi:periplasmic protein CpxP/Spy